MSWEFEHWDNGKVYLHEDRWSEFRKNVEKTGLDHPHNWNNSRIFCRLHTPRKYITELPALGDEDLKYKISHHESWRMIYQPFPAFVRTNEDPEGWLPSWHLWGEDHSKGDEITFLQTNHIFKHTNDSKMIMIGFTPAIRNTFVSFQGQFWLVDNIHKYGIGPNPPPPSKQKKKNKISARSIFEEFKEPW